MLRVGRVFGVKYNPALDGLRALAVMLVLLHHCEVPLFHGGSYGVDLFFVLSGFLITSLLRDEAIRSGRIDIKRFYLRRAVRLWPALILMLALYAMAAPWFFQKANVGLDVLLAGLYLSDYSFAFWHVPDYLRHTWSLAVEEHFYLLWPAVIIITARWDGRRLAVLFLTLAVIVTLWRFMQLVAFDDWWYRIYFSFDTRSSGLIVGAAAAALPWRPDRSSDALAYAALAAMTFMVVFFTTRGQFIFGSVLIDLIGGALVLAIAGKPGRVAALLSVRPLVYLGVLSYSIYLISYPLLRAIEHQYSVATTFFVVAGGSLLFAAISFEFVEKPLKQWRHSLKAHPATA
jgi:peptidoglycan/LPS O-acetylase OafA/YrhL